MIPAPAVPTLFPYTTLFRSNTITGNSQIVTLVSGQTDLTIDAGLYKPAALGDYVWEDSNCTRLQYSHEPSIYGVSGNLTGAGFDGIFGNGDDTFASTTTGAS